LLIVLNGELNVFLQNLHLRCVSPSNAKIDHLSKYALLLTYLDRNDFGDTW